MINDNEDGLGGSKDNGGGALTSVLPGCVEVDDILQCFSSQLPAYEFTSHGRLPRCPTSLRSGHVTSTSRA